jgi:hypothetical protein
MVGGGAVAGQDPEPRAISLVIGQTGWASLFHPGILQPFTAFLDLCPVQKLSPIVLGSSSSVYSVRCTLFAP